MTGPDITRTVIDTVLKKFSDGLEFYPDAEHFMLSYEGLSSSEEIIAYITNRDNYDSSLFSLIIYPDDPVRHSIENIIPAEGCSPESIDEIAAAVKNADGPINIKLYDKIIPMPAAYFRNHTGNYILKLNLDIDTGIFPDRTRSFTDERILLRKRRFSHTPDSREFFSTLAHGAAVNTSGMGIFSFALDLVDDSGDKIMEQIERKKYFYESAIKDAAEFGSLNSRYSMEFLMSKKVAPPLIGIEEAAEAVKKIDLITSLVYGLIIPSMDTGTEMTINRRLQPGIS